MKRFQMFAVTALVGVVWFFVSNSFRIPSGVTTVLAGLSWAGFAYTGRLSRRRKLGRSLYVGDFVIAVLGEPGVRYAAQYRGFDIVDWRSEHGTVGDPWYTSAHRSSGEPSVLDLTVYDAQGVSTGIRFELSELIRGDAGLDAIMSGLGNNPTELSFRLLLHVQASGARLLVYSGIDQPRRDDEHWQGPATYFGGSVISRNPRDAEGRWVRT